MLQQTRTETVESYYEAFLERFPSIEALAAAPLNEVLAAWSGMGYYRRARQFHEAAQQVVARGGALPSSLEGLLELPGIGPYTAAAIASIAYAAPTPVLDGNVERVLTRLEAYADNPRSAAGRRHLLAVAQREMVDKRPGDFNQAMMELGATVCAPRRPDCARCPLSRDCRAFAEGDCEEYPVLPMRRRPIREKRLVVVARHAGRLLLNRRDDEARLLAGVWELPWVGDISTAAEALGERYGGEWRLQPPSARVRHSITTRALEVSVCVGEWSSSSADSIGEADGLAWVEEARLDSLPTTSLVGKALAALVSDRN